MFDERPEVRDHPRPAIALRGRHDDVRALRPGRETCHELAVDVKERQAAENRLSGPEQVLLEGGHRPGVERLRAMSATRDFRQARRAAGAEIGGDFARLRRLEGQRFAGLVVRLGPEIEHRDAERRGRGPRERAERRSLACRHVGREIDSEDGAEIFEPLGGLGDFGPKVGRRRRSERDEKLRLDRPEEPSQLSSLEERADREGDPRRLSAPDCKMSLGQVREDERHGVAALDPETAEEVARLRDAAKEVAIRPDRRPFEAGDIDEERQRRRVRFDRRAPPQHLIGRLRKVPLRERRALDGEHVLTGGDRHRLVPEIAGCSLRHGLLASPISLTSQRAAGDP